MGSEAYLVHEHGPPAAAGVLADSRGVDEHALGHLPHTWLGEYLFRNPCDI